MSNKSNACKSCGSDLEREEGYMVCLECGLVSEDKVQFADDPTQSLYSNNGQLFSQQTVHASIRNEMVSDSHTTPARKMGIRVAETLAINYNFNREMKDYMMNIYEKSLNHKNFFNYSLKNKEILAAVCAYVTLMNHNESIAIQYVCQAIGCDCYDFGQLYNQFVAHFPGYKPTVKPIEELVPSVLMAYGFDESEAIIMKERIIDIISIEKACWLVDGRSPVHLINAAAYLSWKSLKPCERSRTKFTQFCRLFKVEYTLTTSERIKELNDVLIKLANHIPIVKIGSIKIHKNNIALYIDEIVKYSNSLIFDLRKDVFFKIIDNQCPQEVTADDSNEDNETQWMNSFKRKSYEKSENGNQFEICLNAENGENEDPDISDTEIESYLRTKKEMKVYKKLRKIANDCVLLN